MGCIFSKGSSQNSPKERVWRKGSLDRRVSHVSSSRQSEGIRHEGIRHKDIRYSGDVNIMLIDKKKHSSNRFFGDQVDRKQVSRVERNKVENCGVAVVSQTQVDIKRLDDCDVLNFNHPGWGRVPKSVEAEQIAAGWPSWLASAAGEVIKGWVPRLANTFEKLDRIGQGTYSNVYKARDITTNKLVALKKVRFDKTDLESVKFMAREILILRRLEHPNIIKLEGLITSQSSSTLYLVFEYMEHDLTGLTSLPGNKFTEPQIKCHMKQLLTGLDHCHSHGVLHRDIKGSNLLIDDNGVLKIADFGLATFFDPWGSSQLTSRVVTLWYRPPELLLGATSYEVAVDLWSAGCILGELYTGKPILPGRTEVEQLHKIFKLCGSPSEDYWVKSNLPHSAVIRPQRHYRRCVAETFRDLPAPAVGLIETLLSMDPAERGTTASALKSEFFTIKPFACEPSSLPKYPPSKEIDAKLWEEEAKRQCVSGKEAGKKVTVNALASNVNTESGVFQKRHNFNVNSRGEMLTSHKEKTVSGFLVDPAKRAQIEKEGKEKSLEDQPRVSRSGPLVSKSGWIKSGRYFNNPHAASAKKDLSSTLSFMGTRNSSHASRQEEDGTTQPEVVSKLSRVHESSNRFQSSTKQNENCQTQGITKISQADGGISRTGEPSLYGLGPRGNKIYVSGPLLVPSTNMEDRLKEHDRKIQEFARQRIKKSNVGKTDTKGTQEA